MINNLVNSADRLMQMESQIRQLFHKNVLLDHKNGHQDREIRLLKTLVSNIITKQNDKNNNEDLLKIQKRPVRLLPPNLHKYTVIICIATVNCPNLTIEIIVFL